MADLLLIDNDARIAELVAFFLRRSGHSVRTAPSFLVAEDGLHPNTAGHARIAKVFAAVVDDADLPP